MAEETPAERICEPARNTIGDEVEPRMLELAADLEAQKVAPLHTAAVWRGVVRALVSLDPALGPGIE